MQHVVIIKMILKICNFKKGNRDQIESEKVYKQVRGQLIQKQVEDTGQGLLQNGKNSKAFAIPILNAICQI